ncbi:15904_t:CDS:1, partial [Cetraspora pellucida]
SYKNSNRKIEPELINIIQRNRQINGLISNCKDTNLSEALSTLASRKSSRSLGDYEISNKDAINFITMSRSIKKEVCTGTESDSLPETFFAPKRMNAYVSRDFMKLLIKYYNNAYETDIFVLPEDLELDG